MSAVNGSLWTIKVEILLYLSIPLVIAAIVWLHKRSRIFSTTVVFAVIYLASTIYRIYMQEMYDETGCEIYDILSRQVFGQLMYFYSGVFIYTKYDLLKCYSNHLIVAATILFVCSDNIPGYHYWLSPIVVSTLVIFISLLKGAKYFNHNNVSYDIYLLHFPVMQTIYVLFHDKFAPHILFAITLLSILALSEFSWHVIGKRFLK
jgi:peptidoglycan/LPS O-acetylase OafA/YrhL